MFKIESRAFTGPMDLLLDLIRDSKVDIYDIEISSITEKFLQAMQELDINVDDLSDFIRMASLLVLMKASTLIKDSTREEEIPDREELIRRLVEYQRCKWLASQLSLYRDQAIMIHTKLGEDPEKYRQEEEIVITGQAEDLHRLVLNLINKTTKKEDTKFQYKKIVNIEEYPMELVANKIKEKLIKGQKFTFIELLSVLPFSRAATIASFLTLLELSKNKAVKLSQNMGEKEISIKVIDKKMLKGDKDE